MGRGDLAKVRSAKDRQRQKKARDARKAAERASPQGREEEVGVVPPPLRRYRGFMADSDRWRRFAFREGDVVITTPSKCGTTWMQSIVGMLVLGRPDLGEPIGRLSPWLDMLIVTDEEVFGRLEAQRHRRFIKTHTPLDSIPSSMTP